jgi:hypothetical protein
MHSPKEMAGNRAVRVAPPSVVIASAVTPTPRRAAYLVPCAPVPYAGPGCTRRSQMIWPRACPRCRGDLALESDPFGEFMCRFQCRMILNESQEGSLRTPATARRFFGNPGGQCAILDLSRPPAPLGEGG